MSVEESLMRLEKNTTNLFVVRRFAINLGVLEAPVQTQSVLSFGKRDPDAALIKVLNISNPMISELV